MNAEQPTPLASVLLVDDTPANLLALSAVLKPLGARLVEAKSGVEALECVRREPFAVVLLDVQMPGMDGFEVARRMRATEHGREVPILFLTAIHRDEAYARRGYAIGAADYITKPFNVDVLRARVKAFVDLFQQREEIRKAQVELRTRERDEAVRRLVAFERIATAALDTDDLGVLLRELLDIFLGAADAADTATVLLREGEELRVRAAVGPHGVDEGMSVRIGEGLCGAIAAGKQPVEVEGTSTFPDCGCLQSGSTRALYGMPLLHFGEVVGVALIGSNRASSFSEAEKRLFAAMAERAAWAVARHLQRATHEAERAALLERERAARAEAELASQAKDQFLATVSHELRTPLNAILGWAVLARQKAPPQVERALSVIERNARAQARIIDDVLDISRIVSGKFRLDMVPTNLVEVTQAAVESLRPVAEARGVKLAIALGPLGFTLGDPERLQQVVWNLLSNAIKFTPKDGTVELSAFLSGSNLLLRVTDTGQGIDASFMPYIFEAFRQADGSTARRHGGLGLGLALVKQMVQAHGGTIFAVSDGIGKGSTFTVELPIRSTPATRASEDETAAANEQRVRLSGLKVLVVDDEEDARALLRRVLEEKGATVTLAASSDEALDDLSRSRPDVLVSDIGLPGMDGYALIRSIRTLPAEYGGRTPAIALTAYARTEDSQRAFAAGFQRHVPKPVDLGRLVSLIANLCGIPLTEA
ncbi:response regulator [Polyangium jinanense]|uniref:histidine kinase n=1 Tax=Polyangium jinanense TaxID=2829994 RepID=A0A9X4ASX6_9BACT|nr:response regulator [Polyangium jinanense]MDC3956209.1 response regulator [Polyangium jinanense]MDC3982956.1 response regulator [Polyangium jinanense]